MFTGIIKEIGTVEEVKPEGSTSRLSVRADILPKEAKIGDSISVDGTCLTLVDKSEHLLYFDLMKETLKTTTLGSIGKDEKVNLEPSLGFKEGLSGHLVSGHIDEIGTIRRIRRFGQGVMQFMVGASQKGRSLLVQKGSVAVNGISLTVNGIGRDFFIVDIIPHTVKATTMGLKREGSRVNIEFDIIGKYVLRSLSEFKSKTIDKDFLKEHGFI